MEEISGKEDLIGRLIREEGLLSTSPGFTDRVMLRIGEIRQKEASAYKPLISTRTWIFIAVLFAILLAVCFITMGSANQGKSIYPHIFKSAAGFITAIRNPFHINSGALLLTALIMGSAGLLLLLDIILSSKLQRIFK